MRCVRCVSITLSFGTFLTAPPTGMCSDGGSIFASRGLTARAMVERRWSMSCFVVYGIPRRRIERKRRRALQEAGRLYWKVLRVLLERDFQPASQLPTWVRLTPTR